MRFRRCSINRRILGCDESELESPDYLIRMTGGSNSSTIYAEFAMALAVAHTVVIDNESGIYQSESPDEEALVAAGEKFGWNFVGRRGDKVTLRRTCSSSENFENLEIVFDIIATIPFDSTRKRMSVVAIHPLTRRVVVYCKGADNIIFERAAGYAEETSRELLEEHLRSFANDGLRTLVLAMRVLEGHEYDDFFKLWKESQSVVVGRKELVYKAAAIVENNLTVLGATAIEDRLQDGVPETIADLRTAGIKIWVLTGDKVETAVNIAHACKLIDEEMILIRLHETGDDIEAIIRHLEFLLQKLKRIVTKDRALKPMWDHVNASIHQRGIGLDQRQDKFDHNVESSGGLHTHTKGHFVIVLWDND